MSKQTQRQYGFTLIELSIVLIIIGFIIAGIAAGQSLVKQSALTGTISQFNSYTTAVNNFRLKYGYLPGDMPNASNIWPSAVNGNGNGKIEPFSSDFTVIYAENLNAWHQLSLAGVISGNYQSGGTEAQIGTYNPVAKYSPAAGFDFDFAVVFGKKGVTMSLAAKNNLYTLPVLNAGAITPQDAASVDLKIDDGNPGTGSLLVEKGNDYNGDATKCVDQLESAPLGTPVNFLFNDSTPSCRMFYYLYPDS